MRSVSLSRRSFARAAFAAATVGLAFHAAGLLTPSPALAAASPVAEIMLLHASHGDGGGSVDPRIGNMPQLSRPPLNKYDTFKLLDRKVLPVLRESPTTYALPNGRTLQVTLLDVTPDRRFHVRAEITQPDGKAYLKVLEVTAAANEPFFVGGQRFDGGALVVGVTMKP